MRASSRAGSHGSKQIDVQHVGENIRLEFFIATDDSRGVDQHMQVGQRVNQVVYGVCVRHVKDFLPDFGGKFNVRAETRGHYTSA
jgi:hypothetical protein